MPLLMSRVIDGEKEMKRGEILIPELLAKGMKVKVGDMVVIVATNKDGSVNGKQFKVGGILESVSGPGGRDGYIHIDDAVEVLRMEEPEVSEFADPAEEVRRASQLRGGAGCPACAGVE